MTAPEDIKGCCAAAYSCDLVGLLLGESYHPGGLRLTRTLASRMKLAAGERVLDVAAGRGTSALMLATEYATTVDGVDLSEANVALATGAAASAGLGDHVSFKRGDAESLPCEPGAYDAVVCECALCTFPDKSGAAAQMAKALRPGGRVGLTDVVADRVRLPVELTSLSAWVACIADARRLQEYADILTAAGLRVTHTERHDPAMVSMVEQIRARIDVLRLTSRSRVEAIGLDFDRAGPLLDAAHTAAASGALGYALLVAEKPAWAATTTT